jgi:ATP-dependent RNA helicase MRH4
MRLRDEPKWKSAPTGAPRTPVPGKFPRATARDRDRDRDQDRSRAAVPLHRQRENVELAAPRPFSAFELNDRLNAALDEMFPRGKTMPIQTLSLGHLLSSGRHRAILGAETGSGKTLAYLLPLLHHLKATDEGPSRAGFDRQVAPRALVLQPTHELTRQSTAVAKSFSHHVKLSVSGASSPGTVRNLGPVDVLFSTGRSASHLLALPRDEETSTTQPRRKDNPKEEDSGRRIFKPEQILNLSRLEWLIIDEADVILGPSFQDETARVLDKIREVAPKVNILLVTATLPPSLLRATESMPLLKTSRFDQHLSPGLHRLPKLLETRFVPWSKGGHRQADVAHEIKRVFADEARETKLADEAKDSRDAQEAEAGQEQAQSDAPRRPRTMAVVFCGSVGQVKSVTAMLESKDIPALAWTGETAARNERPGHNGPLDAFLVQHKKSKDNGEKPKPPSTKSPRVLVTTSLLSRGLDFSPLVTTTYLLDPPRNVLDFVHRAGRSGRAGRPGRVVVFGMAHAGESQYATQLRDVLGKTETRRATKPGGRTWSGQRQFGMTRKEKS